MGILSTSNAGSALVFYPLNAWLILTLGWRQAFVAFGGVVTVATVSLALLYRNPPMEARPPADETSSLAHGAPARDDEWTLRDALASTRLWAAGTMWALGVIG